MSRRKKFTVINPPITFWLLIGILLFFVVLNLAYTLLSPPHMPMYIGTTIFVFIPGIIVALWTRMFRITVDNTNISVRKKLGLVHFNFDVTEIDRVKWKFVETKFGLNEVITVFTLDGKNIQLKLLWLIRIK